MRRPNLPLFLLTLLALTSACKATADSDTEASVADEASSESSTENTPPSRHEDEAPSPTSPEIPWSELGDDDEATALVPGSWIRERVGEAYNRLEATEGGRQLLETIGAHGGLAAWYAAGPLEFRFRYGLQREEPGAMIDSVQQVDTWRGYAAHHLHGDPNVRFGWSEQGAWQTASDEEIGTNPRFWALTPYYFAGIPWVLADPGVELGAPGEALVEGERLITLRASFGEDVGDAPDDYYVLLIDPESEQVRGVRYVVSYPGFYEEGSHSPEKILFYEDLRETEGLIFARRFRSYLWTEGAPGEPSAHADIPALRFVPELQEAAFAPPREARMREGY